MKKREESLPASTGTLTGEAGPGVVAGSEVSKACVGLQDVGQTLLELVGAQPLDGIDGRSFARLLASPHDTSAYQQGFAEYYGGRYIVSQRLLWDGTGSSSTTVSNTTSFTT